MNKDMNKIVDLGVKLIKAVLKSATEWKGFTYDVKPFTNLEGRWYYEWVEPTSAITNASEFIHDLNNELTWTAEETGVQVYVNSRWHEFNGKICFYIGFRSLVRPGDIPPSERNMQETEFLCQSSFADCMRNSVKSLFLTVMGQAGLRPLSDVRMTVVSNDGYILYNVTAPKQEPRTTVKAIFTALDGEFEKISWLVGLRVYIAAVNETRDGSAVNLSLSLEPPQRQETRNSGESVIHI